MLFVYILQVEGDLLKEEFNDIWSKAPKFPEVTTDDDDERIDVDSFVQVYRDIDDLFEDVDDETEKNRPSATTETTKQRQVSSSSDISQEEEDELEAIFQSLSDEDNCASKDAVKNWDEVQQLLVGGLLGEDEFDALWNETGKALDDKVDLEGFISLNIALDGLFELVDEEEDDDEEAETEGDEEPIVENVVQPAAVQGADLSPADLFAALSAGTVGTLTRNDLSRWGDLQDMLSDGDILMSELDDLFAMSATTGVLDQSGFISLYKAIEDLFEDDDEEEEEATAPQRSSPPTAPVSDAKATLVRLLDSLNSDEERLPCGLESTDQEQREILKLVNSLEGEPSNIIRQKRGAVGMDDLAGAWEMLYSSSSAMKFNKGLSGLGGSFPNGKFDGLKQRLDSSKFMTDVEYTERIRVTPDTASFDVKVTGDWYLRQSVSLFTGEPSTVLQVEPDRVEYGPTSTRADHWKSLGPLNMLDVAYLDEDLRIMRGNTSVDTVFIFRRSS